MGQTEVVRFLVARGANLELRDPKFNSTAFGWAMEFNQGETMSAIRELGYRLDIWEAAGFGDLDRLEELTSGDPSLLNAIRWGTPLSCACVANQLETVRWLLSRGADPKIANREGKLPLDLARERNFGAIAELIRGI
jgi:ankyrin repeat protein